MILGMMMQTQLNCWSCQGDSAGDSATCGWCGVWLVDLDPSHLPTPLERLLPLAKRWGIPDDCYRSDALESASRDELDAILRGVDAVDIEHLEAWLCGPETETDAPSNEYVAVTCLTMAADQAESRLRRAR